MKLRKGMILAAGYGKRMLPITKEVPKPLIKIGKKTLLENSILILKKFGIEKIVINTHHLSNNIKKYVNKKNFNVDITIVEEKNSILDTGGGIFNASKIFNEEPFIVLNPDTIWNDEYISEFNNMEKIFFEKKIPILLLVNKNKSFDKSFKGDFNLSDNGLISKNKSNRMIYTGAQIIDRKIFKNCTNEPFSINRIWDELIAKKHLIGLESYQNFFHLNSNAIYKKLTENYFTR